MVTLGEIISINADTNLCLVKLPTLEGAGNKNKIELHATMMLPPGIDAGYEVGDVVFVSFVDNTLGRPMVLGQLYRGPGKGTKIDKLGNLNDNSLGCAKTMTCENFTSKDTAICNNLEVTGSTKIPQGTWFTGAESAYNTPSKLISKVTTLENKVTTLENKVTTLENKVADLEGDLSRTKTALVTFATSLAAALALSEPVAATAAGVLALAFGASEAADGLGDLIAGKNS